jgi:exodeoxyribonuclease VII small subunit
MPSKETTLTFEAALQKLEQAAEALKKDDTALQDAMAYFEEGLKQYDYCSKLLSEAKQKILVFDKDAKGMKELE